MKIIAIILSLISFSVAAKIERTTSCFSSDNNKMKLKYVEIYDNKTPLSYVKYSKSTSSIPLVFSKETEEEVEGGRPAERNTTWLEVVDGKINGKYEIMSQGGRYYSFIYKGSNGKEVNFNEDVDAYNSEQDDCIWKAI